MKILWVTFQLPYPPNTGGKQSMFYRINHIAEKNEVFLFSYCSVSEFSDENSHKVLKQISKEAKFVKKQLSYRIFRFPYGVSIRYNDKLIQYIKYMKPELIIFESPYVASPILSKDVKEFLKKNGIKTLIYEHNIDHLLNFRQSETSGFPYNLIYRIEGKRLKKYERLVYGLVDKALFISLEDMNYYINRGFTNKENAAYCPPYVPAIDKTNEFKKDNRMIELEEPFALFVGSLDNRRNLEGINWIVQRVIPKISLKEFKIVIAGRNPGKKLFDITSRINNIVIYSCPSTDFLKSLYKKAQCVLIPLLSGSGIKFKTIEALAYKKVVITTSIGAEGIELENNKHCLIADSEREFADNLMKVLEKPSNFESLGVNGYNHILDKFGEKALEKFESELLNLLRK